jgi:hypothetical protein
MFHARSLTHKNELIAGIRIANLARMDYCAERDRLKAVAVRALHDIIEFSDKLLRAIDNGESATGPLDRDLENAMGNKERAFGALNQHLMDHYCWLTFGKWKEPASFV